MAPSTLEIMSSSAFPFEDFREYVSGAFRAPKDPAYQDSKFHNRLQNESDALLKPLIFKVLYHRNIPNYSKS